MIDNLDTIRKNWIFLLVWLLTSVLAWTIGYGLGNTTLYIEIEQEFLRLPLLRISTAIVGGLICAALQLPLLKTRVTKSFWLITSGFGWVFGATIGVYAEMFEGLLRSFCNPLFPIFDGLVVGLFQWFALQEHTENSGWWVVISIAGVAIADGSSATLRAVAFSATENLIIGALLLGAVYGSIYGMITGIGILWLTRETLPSNQFGEM